MLETVVLGVEFSPGYRSGNAFVGIRNPERNPESLGNVGTYVHGPLLFLQIYPSNINIDIQVHRGGQRRQEIARNCKRSSYSASKYLIPNQFGTALTYNLEFATSPVPNKLTDIYPLERQMANQRADHLEPAMCGFFPWWSLHASRWKPVC